MIQNFSEIQLILKLKYPANQPNAVVDVGAHVGTFSFPFAKAGWRVIAFEPEDENYQEFSRNFKSFPNVTCVKKAVSDTAGENIPFYKSTEHWGIHSLKPFHPTHEPSMTVETVRLDDVLTELMVSYVTILKIDVEGADFSALKSFDFETFHPEVVICEFMDERSVPNFGYTHHDMVSYMKERGYTAFVAEWAPIVEYGKKGVPCAAPHRFLQCVPYPLDHDPAWGNLIWVPQNRVEAFQDALSGYLRELEGTADTSPPKEANLSEVNSLNQEGISLFNKGDVQGALTALTKAVKIAPNHPMSHGNLGVLYLKSNDLQNAVNHFNKALALDPNDRSTVLNCGNLLRFLKKPEEAKALYASYLGRNPHDEQISKALKELG